MDRLTRIGLSTEFERYLAEKYSIFKKEVVFNKFMKTKRSFRADYLLPFENIIIEINGGQWINGRHNRGGKGYQSDLTKLNIAAHNGYKVFQFTYEMLQSQEYKKYI